MDALSSTRCGISRPATEVERPAIQLEGVNAKSQGNEVEPDPVAHRHQGVEEDKPIEREDVDEWGEQREKHLKAGRLRGGSRSLTLAVLHGEPELAVLRTERLTTPAKRGHRLREAGHCLVLLARPATQAVDFVDEGATVQLLQIVGARSGGGGTAGRARGAPGRPLIWIHGTVRRLDRKPPMGARQGVVS